METKTILIERTFHMPVSTLWKAWTEPEELKKWCAPEGYTAPDSTIDFQVGGRYLNSMQDNEGNKSWATGVYVEIIPEKRIVFTDSFADSSGNTVSGSAIGMPGEWPDELLVTLEFQEHDDTTLFLLRHEGFPPEAIDDCIQGWQQCFDKLENIFSKRKSAASY